MAKQIITVPDIGGAQGVEIIEIYVAVGDSLEKEQPIIALESDKASMDIPSPASGKVVGLKVNVGDSVSEGDPLIELEVIDTDADAETAKTTAVPTENAELSEKTEKPNTPAVPEKTKEPEKGKAPERDESEKAEKVEKTTNTMAKQIITVPDIGGAQGVEVIEIYVAVGDSLEKEQAIIALESDKASMDIPSPTSGKVVGLKVNVGDSVSEGDPLIELEVIDTDADAEPKEAAAVLAENAELSEKTENPGTTEFSEKTEKIELTEKTTPTVTDQVTTTKVDPSSDIYAGPSVRKFAREISVNLDQVTGTGLRSRITKSNVKDYVKSVMKGQTIAPGDLSNTGIQPIPAVDFSSFGKIAMQKMSKIKKLTAENMSRNWLNVPHVTQFDDADITHLETFRKELKVEAEKQGVKLTLMPFILKACAAALRNETAFNASISTDGTHIVYKDYVHIGVAVDTPAGLMVPVLRDVDKKGLWKLAAEFGEITQKARDGKLTSADMQGGCFTLSSLGTMGGNGFTPIVNAPEVAILGISKASTKPVWDGNEFVPRQMLPLSLSYDHRAVNGADAGRFFTYLTSVIADVRRLLL